MDAAAADRAIRDIQNWLLSEGRFIEGTGAFDEAFVHRLIDTGLPVTRFTTGVPSLHPQVDSFSTLWQAGEGVSFRQYRLSGDNMDEFERSPIWAAYYRGEVTRRNLDEPRTGDYEILDKLQTQGFTGYVVLPIAFSDGSNKAVTFATNEPGGFSDEHFRVLDGLRPAFATAIEVRYLRHMAGTLMDTYVGPVAGRRVLEGAIRRGMGETIRAAIWFCDLKGFTSLSELLPGQQLLDLLNDYFDAMTPAIEAADGEVLKFIGDAILAIFPPGDTEPDADRETAAARRALAAAHAAVDNLADTNARRHEAGQPPIECGIALHFGDVLYGNVGGQSRLDFTVIGPAVNLASRIEGQTRDLKRPVLVSSAFVALHGGDFEPLGEYELKGVGEARAVYAPRASAP